MSSHIWSTIIAVPAILVWTVPLAIYWRAAFRRSARQENERIGDEINVRGGSDAALLDLMGRYPKNPIPAARWAERKIDDKDWNEAIRRSEIVRAKFPKHSKAYWVSIRAMNALGEVSRAGELTNDAIRLFPNDQDTMIEQAERSHRQQDWPTARRKWEALRLRFPQTVRGYMWEAVASTNMHDLKAANCVLQAGMDIVMNDQRKELLVPYADTAHRLEEWTEAARRWELVRETNYNEPMGYWKGSEALRKVGNLAAAARVLASGTVMFPNDEHIATEARAIEQDA